MIGIVVVTHSQLGVELLNAAEMIVGELPRFTAVSVAWHDDSNNAREEIEQAMARMDQGDGILIVTDMFGETPSNLAMTFLTQAKVEVVTGVNLPMLIKLAELTKQTSVLDAARSIREHGRDAIWVASDLLRGEKAKQ